jgi:hypothetical protein
MTPSKGESVTDDTDDSADNSLVQLRGRGHIDQATTDRLMMRRELGERP